MFCASKLQITAQPYPNLEETKTHISPAMKHSLYLLLITSLFLTSCSSIKQASVYDDVYYNPKKVVPTAPDVTVTAPTTDESTYNQPQPTPSVQDAQSVSGYDDDARDDGSGYNDEDYYDYAYSARLKRFYNPYFYGNYYSDYYTNLYWYDYNPYSWGTSIYMGYNWWYPSWDYGWNSCYSPYYNDWYSPWYGNTGYYGWGSYYSGYWDGYYSGYYNHWGNNYFNSHDQNSNYYGHRGSSIDHLGGGARPAIYNSFGDMYEANRDKSSPSTINTHRTDGNSGNRPVINNTNNQLPAGQGQRTPNPGYNTGNNNAGRRVVPAPTDTRTPANGGNTGQPQRRYQTPTPGSQTDPRQQGNTVNGTQTYSSPNYNRPRSNQEYTSPKYRVNTQPSDAGSGNSNRTGDTRRGDNQPRPVMQPVEHSQPTQSSGNSYTPSRSSGSDYTPSRSSGSSSSGSSNSSSGNSGSSGGGHRR